MIEDGIKISELNTTTTYNDEDIIPIVQNNETKSIKAKDLNCDVYSTTETIIGKWIDGTPIYRLVVTYESFSMQISQWVGIYSLANVRAILGGHFGAYGSSSNASWNDTNIGYVNGKIAYFSETYTHQTNYFIVEYLKTTDV